MFCPKLFLLILLLVWNAAADQSIQEVSQVFRDTQIVPDVIPAFNPSVLLGVSFGEDVTPGQNLTTNGMKPAIYSDHAKLLLDTAKSPAFSIQGATNTTKFVVLTVCLISSR